MINGGIIAVIVIAAVIVLAVIAFAFWASFARPSLATPQRLGSTSTSACQLPNRCPTAVEPYIYLIDNTGIMYKSAEPGTVSGNAPFVTQTVNFKVADVLPVSLTQELLVNANDNRLYLRDTSASAQSAQTTLLGLPLQVTGITYDPTYVNPTTDRLQGRFILYNTLQLYTFSDPAAANATTETQRFKEHLQSLLQANSTTSPFLIAISPPPTSVFALPFLQSITVARTPPGFANILTNYFATSFNSSTNTPVLLRSADLIQWAIADNSSAGGSLTGPATTSYFETSGIAYDFNKDLYYVINTSNNTICKTTTSLGGSSSSGGTFSCVQSGSLLPITSLLQKVRITGPYVERLG